MQVQNAAAVLALLEACGKTDCLTRERVNHAFSKVQLPGRAQFLECGRTWLLDVAHNADAAHELGG